MRLRPQDPEELDMVDWRGRFYDDEDDEYDHEDGAEEDRPMEDFDPVSDNPIGLAVPLCG